MKTGAKVWLWIMLVANVMALVSYLFLTLTDPAYILYIVAEAGMITAVCLMLFFRRRLGFYLFLCVAAVALVMNIMFGAPIVSSLIGAVVGPFITYLVLTGSWEALA